MVLSGVVNKVTVVRECARPSRGGYMGKGMEGWLGRGSEGASQRDVDRIK